MKHSLRIIFIILFLSSCNLSKKTEKNEFNEKQISFITNFVANLNTHSSIEKKDSTIQYYFKIVSSNPSTNNRFVYILNGECSVCISYLVKFICYLKEANIEIPITVITDKEDIQNVKYYIQKFDILAKNDLSYRGISENQYTNKLDFYNGIVLYIHENQIINSFSFFDLINDPNFIL